MKRWLLLFSLLLTLAIAPVAVMAQDEETGDTAASAMPPDNTLRDAGAKEPVATADGSQLETPASHMILMDYNSGSVLAQKAPDKRMYPSSMTKMMTLYVIFDRLKEGSLSMDNQFTVSENAWRMQGSKMFVPLGEQIPLHDLIMGIAVQSGNDACVTTAEGLAGSETAFAQIMNEEAKKLGMTNTNFVDSSGWPNENHYTTAHDLALLAAALIRDFPQYYHYFSEPEFTYHNIRQFNRNSLLRDKPLGVDGLKTGHTDAAGYGITLSAKELATGRRLVLVINGLDSEKARAEEGKNLLTWGFRNFEEVQLASPSKPIVTTHVWQGTSDTVALTVKEPLILSIGRTGRDKIKTEATYSKPLNAPVSKGQEVGTLKVTLPNGTTKEVPLVAADDVARRGFFSRIGFTLKHLF
jgi:D-alanyl-D-alanine carboxypeptidase (penicillin-binding protein 5/6)